MEERSEALTTQWCSDHDSQWLVDFTTQKLDEQAGGLMRSTLANSVYSLEPQVVNFIAQRQLTNQDLYLPSVHVQDLMRDHPGLSQQTTRAVWLQHLGVTHMLMAVDGLDCCRS